MARARAEELDALLRKLKANREKVPKILLMTKYKDPYKLLLDQIAAIVRDEAAKIPREMIPARMPPGYMREEMQRLFDAAMIASGEMGNLRRALYHDYDAAEAMRAAGAINQAYTDRLADYIHSLDVLIVQPDLSLRLFNTFLGKIWDEDEGEWRAPRPDEPVPYCG